MSSTPLTKESNTNPIPPRTADTPTKVYKGGCHCGKFEFQCRHPVLEDGFEVVSCNCSICTQRGYLGIYIPDPKDFTLLKGSETELTRYQFNKKFLTHVFCTVCGSGLFAMVGDNKVFGVNVRTLSGIDLEKLTLKKNNGRAL
ncbi:Mss4-like protein [Gautieria morchelliformis]|nr:Mss4-like protein [Gautieria morchelliformis]